MKIVTKQLYVTMAICAALSCTGLAEARWASFLNESADSITINIDNGRSKLEFTLDPGEDKLFEVKPDSFWDPRNVHYVTHNEKTYILANGEDMNPFEAQKVNTYIALSSDDDALNDSKGHTIVLNVSDDLEVTATTPNPELNAFTSKVKAFYLDNKEAIDSTTKDAANKLADKATDKFFDADEEEQEELATEEISVNEDKFFDADEEELASKEISVNEEDGNLIINAEEN